MGKVRNWFKDHTVDTVVIGGALVVFVIGGWLGYKLGVPVGINRGMAKMCKILWKEIAHLPVSEHFNILCDADHSPELTEAAIEHLKSHGFDPANAAYVVLATKPE